MNTENSGSRSIWFKNEIRLGFMREESIGFSTLLFLDLGKYGRHTADLQNAINCYICTTTTE